MAQIVGEICTSHIPSIGNAIAKGLSGDPYGKPFFDGFPSLRAWLDQAKPDVAVVLYNDHGLNFFLDKMPTFAIGAAFEYANDDEGWGLPTSPPFAGDPQLSWHVIETLMQDEFDICSCQEMLVDHAFTVPMQLLWPTRAASLRTVPISFNTVQHPIPSPSRCYCFGRSLGRAIASYPEDLRVVVIGTGGLSHQLDGTRAGFINKAFDLKCLDKIVDAPEALTAYSAIDLVREAGAQGAEFIMWLAMRGALTGTVRKLHSSYHIPISNTAAGILLLENKPQATVVTTGGFGHNCTTSASSRDPTVPSAPTMQWSRTARLGSRRLRSTSLRIGNRCEAPWAFDAITASSSVWHDIFIDLRDDPEGRNRQRRPSRLCN